MRLLWASNYVAQSSYANQARLIVPRLQALGHEVFVFNLGGHMNTPGQIGGVYILPPAQDLLGNDIILGHTQKVDAHAVISWTDQWALDGQTWGRTNWYPLTPVDHMPVPPAVVNSIRFAQQPIAISQFGLDQMRRVGFDPLYAPCCYDPALWTPGDKAAARQAVGVHPDHFLAVFVGVNDSNPSRKGISELLTAWSAVGKGRADYKLYLHTSVQGNRAHGAHNGVDVDAMILSTGIDPQTIILPDEYRYRTGIPQAELLQWARAADVLVLPSRGEGFGLPLIEFQAVGCPVITTDFAAQKELCFGGWLIGYEPDWSWQSAYAAKPGIADLCDALVAAAEERNDPKRRQQAIEGAREYAVDVVVERHWRGVIQHMAERWLAQAVAQ